MKKTCFKIAVISYITIFTNCASVQLSDAYTSEGFKESISKKILILARSEDDYIRESYENELVSKLKSQHLDAVSALDMFPDLKVKKDRTQEEKLNILKLFRDSKIEAIVLIALKDTRIDRPETNYNDNSYIPTNSKGKYGISFIDYYNVNSVEYLSAKLKPIDFTSETENTNFYLKSTTYILEAVIYDLTLDDNQLVGAFEVEAVDPNSAKNVLKSFTSIIAKEFKR